MSKYSAKLKITACKEYLSGKFSNKEICEKYGMNILAHFEPEYSSTLFSCSSVYFTAIKNLTF